MTTCKFAVCGHPQHGKSTFSKALSDELERSGFPGGFGDTSSVLVDQLAKEVGLTAEQILNDKERWRPDLIRIGNLLTDNDPSALSRPVLESSAIVAGLRRRAELDSLRHHFPGLIIIWIERAGYNSIRDNLEITANDCLIEVLASDIDGLQKASDGIVGAISCGLLSKLVSADKRMRFEF